MPTLTVIEEFKFSPDGRETIVYEPGEYEIVPANPRPGQVTELCAEYAERKGKAIGEGAPNLLDGDPDPLEQPATVAKAAKTTAKGKKKS